MRLTDDVLRMSDVYHSELVSTALLLSVAGRFGLLPSTRPFKISLDINKNNIDVVAADILAVTKSGQLIDVSFDSRFSGLHNTQIVIPANTEDRTYLLLVVVTGEWQDAGDGSCEAVCQFALQEEKMAVPDDSVPVARIVNDNGWREDDVDFVPPCLYLNSHSKFLQVSREYVDLLSRLDVMVPERLSTDSGDARRVFWPEVRRLRIVMDKENETMTPMSLLARVQECVSSFYCACVLDECLSLSEGDKFLEYARSPYDFRNAYKTIHEGIQLTSDICKKLEDFVAEPVTQPKRPEVSAPVIANSELHQFAVSNDVKVEVSGVQPGALALYSIDGSDPVTPLEAGHLVPLNPGFNKTRTKENDRKYTVKLKAIQDGESSSVSFFEITVTKDVNIWKGFQI